MSDEHAMAGMTVQVTEVEISSPLPTARQLEVLRLVAKGQTQKQIALELGISINGVKRRLMRTRFRMGMSTFQIVAHLAAIGLIKQGQ